MICQSCGVRECDITEESFARVECPECSGLGCEHCEEGTWRLTECGRKFVGNLARAINLTSYAEKGILPETGGLLVQSNWFLELWTAVNNEQAAIEQERLSEWRRTM